MLQCLWLELVCYVGGRKFLNRKDISVVRNLARITALIFAGLAAELRDILIIPGKS
jgi:hypothetical protein